MRNSFKIFKGLHYRNSFFYYFLTFLKLRMDYDLRFKIASRYISPGDYVLDVCAGTGRLAAFLPQRCHYTGLEASEGFRKVLDGKGLSWRAADLHTGLDKLDVRCDVVVMIISLCHFRETSISGLLEAFKKIGKKVVVVEDVLLKKRGKNSFLQRIMNYFCSVDYFLPMELFLAEEFEDIARRHSYSCAPREKRYMVACYEG